MSDPDNRTEFQESSAYAASNRRYYSAYRTEDPGSVSAGRVSVRRRAYGIVVGALCVLVAVLAFAGITYSAQLWGGKIVPDVIGMDAPAAEEMLASSGFTASQVLVKSDETAGTVISTDPSGGERAAAGSAITLSVATPRTVPNVVGMSEADARAALEAEGLFDVEFASVKSDEPEGVVLAVSPGVGESAWGDTHVVVDIATPYRVPEVAGMSERDAIAALGAAGFKAKTASVYDEDAEEGSVVGTDPAADSPLPTGSVVTINVAKHRATELVEKTYAWFKETKELSIQGTNYEVRDVEDVSYKDGDTVSYRIVARPYESLAHLGLETRYGNYETLRGTITWAEDGTIASSDPSIRRI